MKSKKQNILIITDNPYLAQRFEKEVWSVVDQSKYNLSFKCSPYSSPDHFQLLSNIASVNLKKNEAVTDLISYDLAISIHCKQLFPKRLIENVTCINVHPGYNPINRGWYPQVFSIIKNTPIGATIHEIDEQLDHGNIIAREFVEKFEFDTSKTLYDRVVDKEIELLKNNIQSLLDNSYRSIKPEKQGTLYLKKDFNNLCELDIEKKYTLKEAIDLLRALTHGNYSNAYFTTKNNEKVYISLNLKNEK